MNDERRAAPASDVRRGKALALGAFAAGTLLTAAATMAATMGTAAAAGRPHVSVYFVQGEQLAPVTRPGTTALDAVRQLIAGPTRAEHGRGFRTYVPADTRVRSVSVANGIATVDLTEPFATGSQPRQHARQALGARPHADGTPGRDEGAAARERRRRRRHVPRRLDQRPDHAPLPRDPERARPAAAAREASGARRRRQEARSST